MARKFIAQNSSEDAIVAMNILLDQFSVNGGDFIFDAHYIIGMAKHKVGIIRKQLQALSLHLQTLLASECQ